ncbi:MAG: radical SAM protein [Candidatus Cloacimonetes bacterium]|nr:radical SAM protein [Candidatus Cloacimonadota bacterium]
MNYILFGMQYIANHLFLHKTAPLICGLAVTNECNLHCRQCRIAARGAMNLSFKEIKSAIDTFYREGGRTLYIQGGEPFIWKDGDHTLDDISDYAHKSGFFSSIIYTNGTFPLKSAADTIFVSLDGLQPTHDLLRGKSFERIVNNIRQSRHPSLFINFTINNHNKAEIEDFCEFIKGLPQIKGIFFYFHTPYYGIDELYIEQEERNEIIHKLLILKKKYKILNSSAGLKSAIRNDWKRPLDICQVYEEGKTYKCCRYPGNPELCRNCGYLSYAEIDQALKLKPTALINALKYF